MAPLATPEEAAKQWANYEALKAAILDEGDYQRIKDKIFIKRSGFRKIGVFFGLSDTITEQERTDREDGSFMWRIVVEVSAPNGRISTGVGICDSKERKFAHVEHDCYATAHTRAKSRAISDLVAGGVVSAEEIEAPGNNQAFKNGKSSEIKQENGTINEYKIIDLVEGQGLDSRPLNVYPYGKQIYVDLKMGLGDSWERYNEVLKSVGAEWKRVGTGGRWVIPAER